MEYWFHKRTTQLVEKGVISLFKGILKVNLLLAG